MKAVTIRNYINPNDEIRAEYVRKMPVGSKVILNHFDRYGVYCTMEMQVIQYGKKKMLCAHDYYGDRMIKPIKKETDRLCYTVAYVNED